jgi:succinoglycan biosynthesis transport protein ExoP
MSTAAPPSGLGDYVALLRRRWMIVATILPATVLIALLFAYGLSVLYRSTATLMLEQSSIQENLIAATVSSYADQQIEIVQGRVMDQATLEKLMTETDLYPARTDWTPADKAREILLHTQIERVDPVTLEPLKKSNAFSIIYTNPNPALASKGALALANLFLTYHQNVRLDSAREATVVLTHQAESITQELQAVDQQISALKSRHGGTLPDSSERNEAARDRAERDLDALDRDLRAAQEKESLLAIQLAGLSPRMMTRSGDLTDLATVRAQLAEAQQKYTPDHPDVKRLQRALEALQTQGARDTAPGAIKADNPEYLRVAGQLDAAHRDVNGIRASAERVRAQMYNYSGLMRAAPETEKRGERFAMVWPPLEPSSPSAPNRQGLILLGLVLGLAMAAIALAIAESADPSVRNIRDMGAAADWPVLGSVPPILTKADRYKQVRRVVVLGASYALGIALVAALGIRTAHITAAQAQAKQLPAQAKAEDVG